MAWVPRWFFFWMLLCILSTIVLPVTASERNSGPTAAKILTPEMLGMAREQINFSDRQLRLFNGRGAICVEQYSLTGLGILQFPPLEVPDYHFHLDFLVEKNGVRIRDDVPALWREWIETQTGSDPLGCNFRPGFATVLVSQDEYWQPNLYQRTGTFHKIYSGQPVSFAIETRASVSARTDEIYLEIKISNRSTEPLTLILSPQQKAVKLASSFGQGATAVERPDAFTIASAQMRIRVVSVLPDTCAQGWRWTIPARATAQSVLAIVLQNSQTPVPPVYQPDLAQRMHQAEADTRARLQWAADRLPQFSSNDPGLDDFYRRCLLTVMECRWQRDDFILNPFWAVGTWIFTIAWDNSFTARVLAQLDPEGLKDAIKIALGEGQLKRSYIAWHGGTGEIPYIQEPFALQNMLEAYLNHTGDLALLKEKVAGATVYEWMKKWGHKLHDRFGRTEGGLIDMGPGTEMLIEIRTDGYNHVVPVVNGLAIKLYRQLAAWGRAQQDPEAPVFERRADQLAQAFQQKLWNESAGWFDNLYPNGQRASIWTYHLFDLLSTEVITAAQRQRMVAHIRAGEFLGRFGLYSISRSDRIHWDRIDADWGGGGQYPGVPLQIALALYQTGYAGLGWDILKRFSAYCEYFPYIPQNPRTDRAEQDHSSMPLQISAGAGIEAIVYGLFGIQTSVDGALVIQPAYHEELGLARLTDFQYRGHSFDLEMSPDGFRVSRDGQALGRFPHGERLRLDKSDGQITTSADEQVKAPYVAITDPTELKFVTHTWVELRCEEPGAQIHFRTDGRDPDSASPRYERPFELSATTTVKAQAFRTGRLPSRVMAVTFHKMEFRDRQNPNNIINRLDYPDIALASPPSPHHPPANGKYALLDGRLGSLAYKDGCWLGYEGKDFQAVIALKKADKIRKISTHFLQNHGVWIFAPLAVEFARSSDGKNYQVVARWHQNLPDHSLPDEIVRFAQTFTPTSARFVRVRAQNVGVCPPWHKGAGGQAWIFVDEIVIE